MAAFSVEASLDAYIDAQQTTREPDGLWHPSSIASICDRKSIYDIRGTEKEPLSPRTKRIFRVGHLLHSFIQDAIMEDPTVLFFAPEVPIVAEPLGITGHADGLIEYTDGTFAVLEFKTINSKAFQYGDLPKDDHVMQAMLYMMVLRKYGTTLESDDRELDDVFFHPFGEELRDAIIVYVSKDDLKIGEFHVRWDAAMAARIDTKLQTLNTHRDEGTLPPRLDTVRGKKHYACGYCSYATLCWEDA